MTWSIVARDAATGALGVAVASKVLAVGALCPWAEARVGALSSQSYTNPLYGPDILARLRDGGSIDAAIQAVTAADEGRDWRQVHGVDAAGRAFAYTGPSCIERTAQATGDGVSVAGNMLESPDVVAATLDAWTAGGDAAFPIRLLNALCAGEAAGGDKRGRQSAALRVVAFEAWPAIDLRIDDADRPTVELARLLQLFLSDRAAYYVALPTRAVPAGAFTPAARDAIRRGYFRATGRGE